MLLFGGMDNSGMLTAGGPPGDGGASARATHARGPMAVGGGVRGVHAAVWAGSRMRVFGGAAPHSGSLADGRAYDPATDSWTPLATVNAPTPRQGFTALW